MASNEVIEWVGCVASQPKFAGDCPFPSIDVDDPSPLVDMVVGIVEGACPNLECGDEVIVLIGGIVDAVLALCPGLSCVDVGPLIQDIEDFINTQCPNLSCVDVGPLIQDIEDFINTQCPNLSCVDVGPLIADVVNLVESLCPALQCLDDVFLLIEDLVVWVCGVEQDCTGQIQDVVNGLLDGLCPPYGDVKNCNNPTIAFLLATVDGAYETAYRAACPSDTTTDACVTRYAGVVGGVVDGLIDDLCPPYGDVKNCNNPTLAFVLATVNDAQETAYRLLCGESTAETCLATYSNLVLETVNQLLNTIYRVACPTDATTDACVSRYLASITTAVLEQAETARRLVCVAGETTDQCTSRYVATAIGAVEGVIAQHCPNLSCPFGLIDELDALIIALIDQANAATSAARGIAYSAVLSVEGAAAALVSDAEATGNETLVVAAMQLQQLLASALSPCAAVAVFGIGGQTACTPESLTVEGDIGGLPAVQPVPVTPDGRPVVTPATCDDAYTPDPLLLCVLGSLDPGKFALTGRVIARNGLTPVGGASVTLEMTGLSLTAISDPLGQFAFANMPVGNLGEMTATLRVLAPGYGSYEVGNHIFEGGSGYGVGAVISTDPVQQQLTYGHMGSGDGTSGDTSPEPTQTAAPAAPSGVSAATVSANQINVSWSDQSADENGFKIERATQNQGWQHVHTVGANTTTYADTGLRPSTSYQYRVRAYNSAGDSGYSNTAQATTSSDAAPPPPEPPAAPSGLQANAVSTQRVDLSWTDNSSNETGFTIDRDAGSGWQHLVTTGENRTHYSDDGLYPSSTYTYRVRAFNADGESGYSNSTSATTHQQQQPSMPPVSGESDESRDYASTEPLTAEEDASFHASSSGARFSHYRIPALIAVQEMSGCTSSTPQRPVDTVKWKHYVTHVVGPEVGAEFDGPGHPDGRGEETEYLLSQVAAVSNYAWYLMWNNGDPRNGVGTSKNRPILGNTSHQCYDSDMAIKDWWGPASNEALSNRVVNQSSNLVFTEYKCGDDECFGVPNSTRGRDESNPNAGAHQDCKPPYVYFDSDNNRNEYQLSQHDAAACANEGQGRSDDAGWGWRRIINEFYDAPQNNPYNAPAHDWDISSAVAPVFFADFPKVRQGNEDGELVVKWDGVGIWTSSISMNVVLDSGAQSGFKPLKKAQDIPAFNPPFSFHKKQLSHCARYEFRITIWAPAGSHVRETSLARPSGSGSCQTQASA